MIKRLVPPLALWITTKILETPRVKDQLADIDARTFVGKRKASRQVKRAAKNARRSPAWLAASAAAFAVALGCMAKAGSSKKR
jgi:hypothetical protein